jgi:flagellar motor switch protein FliG
MDLETRVAFASLLLVRVDSLSQGLQAVDWDLLAFALMGANEVVRGHVYRSLNPRLVPLIQGFMDQLEDISQEEISQAQQTVIGMMQFQAERSRPLV